MKQFKIVLSLLISIAVFNVQAQISSDTPVKKTTEITFEESVHDFGDINEGDVVEATFKYTNTGNSPLYITKIKASCGCTIPSNWSREALQPGETGSFLVKFNSKNKPNRQSKRISILCNSAKGNEYVTIKAQVTPDPALEAVRAERAAKRKARILEDKKAKKALMNKENSSKVKKDVSKKKASLK